MPNYAILRVQRIPTRSDLTGLSSHGRRADSGTHYDRSRTCQNLHWRGLTPVDRPVDWGEAVAETVSRLGAAIRANGAAAAEFFFSASAPFFFGADGEWDMDLITRWAEATLTLLDARFPGMVACARLDLDEATPHLSACVVPTYTKCTRHTQTVTVSYNQVLGGETSVDASLRMVELQDWYAEAMRPFGLVRGVAKAITGREHLTHQQYAMRKRREDEARLAAQKELDRRLRLAEAREEELSQQIYMATEYVSRAQAVLLVANRLTEGLAVVLNETERRSLRKVVARLDDLQEQLEGTPQIEATPPAP